MKIFSSIRSGTVGDVRALQALQLRAGSLFRDAGMPEVADNPPSSDALFRESITADLLHVAARREVRIGFTLALATEPDCHLEQMSVDPAFGRQGIGAALVRHLVHLSRLRGFDRVTLSTFTNVSWNGPFYERLGFIYLPNAQLTPFLAEVRSQEAAAGLDMSLRAVMAHAL